MAVTSWCRTTIALLATPVPWHASVARGKTWDNCSEIRACPNHAPTFDSQALPPAYRRDESADSARWLPLNPREAFVPTEPFIGSLLVQSMRALARFVPLVPRSGSTHGDQRDSTAATWIDGRTANVDSDEAAAQSSLEGSGRRPFSCGAIGYDAVAGSSSRRGGP